MSGKAMIKIQFITFKVFVTPDFLVVETFVYGEWFTHGFRVMKSEHCMD